MTILVTGASGFLGREVYSLFQRTESVVGTCFSRHEKDLVKVDLSDKSAISELLDKLKPSAIIHCAAEKRPDIAEKNKELVQKINVDATAEIALQCFQRNIWMIYISTDYVFDGTNPPYKESDQPNPLNFYGLSKYQGELEALKVNPNVCILRVPLLYGHCIKNSESAVNILIDAIKSLETVQMDNFQIRFPTNTGDVARVCLDLYERSKKTETSGIFHFSAKQQMTKFKICQVFGSALNVPISHIQPVNEAPQNAFG